MVKVICKQTHVSFKDGKLDMDNEETRQTMQMLINQLERMIRVQIYSKICDLKLTENRKQIVANGIDNVALTVQDMCARIALGSANE